MQTAQPADIEPAKRGDVVNRNMTGLAGMIRRRPILAFLVWFFTVGQALAFAPLYLDTGLHDQWFIIGSTLIGLLLPAVVITRIVDGSEGLAQLGRRIIHVRAPVRLYLVGVVLMPLVAVGMAIALLGVPEVPPSTLVTALGSGLLLSLVINFFLNNLWEEVAWMGFVQVRLQDRHGAMRAALLVAPLFALQHVSLAVGNDPVSAVVIMLAFTLVVIPFRALSGWLYNRAGASLFLVGLVHALSNAVAPGAGLTDGYLRVLYPADSEVVGLLHLAAVAVIGLAVMASTRLRLGQPDRSATGAEFPAGLAAGTAR